MSRLIILAALAGLGWWLWRTVSEKLGAPGSSSQNTQREKRAKPHSQKLVACEQCHIHIPEGEAYIGQDNGKTLYFCSPDHQQSWQQNRD